MSGYIYLHRHAQAITRAEVDSQQIIGPPLEEFP